MALSIGVSVGSRIHVGEHTLRVKSITNPNLFVIEINGKEMVVSERRKTEVLPGVLVQAGVGKNGGNNRLAFDAPREIRISRMDDTQVKRRRHEDRRQSAQSLEGRVHTG